MDEAEEADEDDGFLERMADTVEEALEGLDEAIEAALDKLEAVVDPEIEMDDDNEIEVTVEEYLDDDDFVAPEQDNDVEVEIIEVEDEEDIFVEVESPVEE